MRPFNANDFSSHFVPKPRPGTYLRPAVIIFVDSAMGTVNVEWLDHPGVRQNVLLTPSGQGIFELPTVGSVVLVGFGIGFEAYILAHIPIGYRDLVGTPRANDQEIAPSIRKIGVGEKMLVSYLEQSEKNPANEFATPITTGTYFHMSNVGDIFMTTAAGDSWELNSKNNIIQQDSMNFRAITEAGILDFGLIKREFTDGEHVVSTAGNPLGSSDQLSEEALTEFRLRILETADANSLTEPEIDNPFIELTLGTKIKKSSDGVFELDKTDSSHAPTSDGTSKEIMIQLKTKADQGFEFTVDKEGNLTVKVKGNVKFAVDGGDFQIDVDDVHKVKIGGGNGEFALLGETFQKRFNSLVDYVNRLHSTPPSGTPVPLILAAPAGTAQKSSSDDLSKKIKSE